MLLDYLNSNPNATMQYYASDIQPYLDSDAAYIMADQAKSRIVEYFYYSNQDQTSARKPSLNVPVLIEC